MDANTLAWIGLALFIGLMYSISNWWGKSMGYIKESENKNRKRITKHK